MDTRQYYTLNNYGCSKLRFASRQSKVKIPPETYITRSQVDANVKIMCIHLLNTLHYIYYILNILNLSLQLKFIFTVITEAL